MRQIITIGRQFGSGGHEIGEQLADRLGYRFYDKDILQSAARKTGICEAILSQSEENVASSLLYSLAMNMRSEPFEDQLARYENRYLREQAEKGSCIIIGRCGNYLFRNDPDLLSVFIKAPLEFRRKRIEERYHLGDAGAERLIISTDKKRASHYFYRTDKRWYDITQYQFVLDSSVYGVDGTVELMLEMIRRRERGMD